MYIYLNPTALRKAKIVYNFGLSECNRVKDGDVQIENMSTKIQLSFQAFLSEYLKDNNLTNGKS